MSFSPLCLSSVGACGGAWSVVPSCGAVSLVVRRSFLVSIVGLLAFFVSVLSAGRMSADCLPCVSRLGAQCGRRVACHAWFVPLIGAGGGTVRLPPSAYLDEAGGECVDYVNCRLSVDYCGAGGYINTRALIGFSFRCFLARACCVGGFSVLLLPPNRSRSMPPLIGSSGARTGAIFFINLHLIPSHLSAACLLVRFLLPGYSHIHIAPLLSPLPSTRMGGEVHGYDTTDGWRAIILLVSCWRRWMATEAVMSCLLDFWRAMSSPSHEMMRR